MTDPLQRLRAMRVRPKPDLSIGSLVERQTKQLHRRLTASQRATAAWNEAAPESIRAVAAVAGLTRGELRIRPRHASGRFLLQRWLAGGGERAIIDAARGAVSVVKLAGVGTPRRGGRGRGYPPA